jgi:hypothetical protein
MGGTLISKGNSQPGLYRLSVTGTGLSADEQAATAERIDQRTAVVVAIVSALAQARSRGLSEFAPSDGLLPLPEGVSAAQMRAAFADVVGVPYEGTQGQTPGYRALTLAEWSDAAMALQKDVAGLKSRLAPGAGGGVSYANGHWFVNGRSFTLAETFLAARMATFTSMDSFMAEQMNRLNANIRSARKVMALTEGLNALYASRGGSTGTYSAADVVTLLSDEGLNLAQVANWGSQVSGGGSFASVESAYVASASASVSASEFASLITEAKAIFDATNADNQVTQVRTDSVVNARQNVVDGMTSFLKAQRDQLTVLARGLQG